jgi:hypothetical protein
MRSALFAAIGRAMHGGLLEKNCFVRYRRQDLPLGPSDMYFQYQILLKYRPVWVWGMYLQECVVPRRVRTN